MGENDKLTRETREQLLVTYGWLKGLSGSPLGRSVFGGVERVHVPNEIIRPLEDLLFKDQEEAAAKAAFADSQREKTSENSVN